MRNVYLIREYDEVYIGTVEEVTRLERSVAASVACAIEEIVFKMPIVGDSTSSVDIAIREE